MKKRNLILTRTEKPQTASVIINNSLLVTVVAIRGKQVRLAFSELGEVQYKIDRLEIKDKGKKDAIE